MTTLIAVLAVTGCGGDSSASTSPSQAEGSGVAIVAATENPLLGKIVVDAKGFTLYGFHKDKGTTSSCYGACAGVWPPLITEGAPKAREGADASKLGTTKRKDGTTQVTYAGHPLYTYMADKVAADTFGNDIVFFGSTWYALTPRGTQPKE